MRWTDSLVFLFFFLGWAVAVGEGIIWLTGDETVAPDVGGRASFEEDIALVEE